MNYEKKYKEALTWIESIYSELSHEQQMEAEAFFPELQESEDEKIREMLIRIYKKADMGGEIFGEGITYKQVIAWLEKQGKQEQLYIRFGEIPTNEKSKIYQGEIEVGTENGVSVYPAFKTSEGDIVLGLSLPITKTTLYTQQHLIEYDNRPCYLVKGDYVGKDTDGQYLINNVSIIEKIGTYRVKEKKQDEQKPTDKSESKFNVGDWIACEELNTAKIISINVDRYEVEFIDGTKGFPHIDYIDRNFHLWAIDDAKPGDILVDNYGNIVIYQEPSTNLMYHSYCYANNKGFFDLGGSHIISNTYPATKEQCDTLFAKMHEAGYEWDTEKKELKKISQRVVSAEAKEALYDKPAWSEEDDNCLSTIIAEFSKCSGKSVSKDEWMRCNDFLNSLKGRVQPQKQWKPSAGQMKALHDLNLTGNISYAGQGQVLIELYNDLKKLTE